MPPKKQVREPSQARSRATVEAILEGASQVLRREGLEGCTTTKVAERAGVSVGTLYQYFPNKEAVFDTLIDRLLEERAERRAAVLDAQEDDEDLGRAMRELIGQLLAIHLADPELTHQLHRYEASRGFTRLAQYEQTMRSHVERQLVRFSERFRPLPDVELASRVLVYSMTGVVERLAREDPESLADPAVRLEVAALLAGYLAPGNPVLG